MSDNPWKPYFDQAVATPAPLPDRIRDMHRLYGKRDGQVCSGCVYLQRFQRNHNHRYFKCRLSKISHSTATDWRNKWPACGRFIARKGDIDE